MTGRRSALAQRREGMGMSQEALAEALRVSRVTVYRWEKGDTEPRPYLRPKLARLLGVSIAELAGLLTTPHPVDPPGIMETEESIEEQPGGDVQRREFLQGIAAIGVSSTVGRSFHARADDVGVSLAALRAGVDRATRLEQGAQYTALTVLLPGLITHGRRLTVDATGHAAVDAARLLGTARVVEAFVLVKQDRPADAQAAATEAIALAHQAGDDVLVGTALRCLGETHMRDGSYQLACDLALEGASHIERSGIVTREALAVQGAGLLTAATACARAGDRVASVDLLSAAGHVADQLRDDVVASVVFGPTNVAIHRVAVEVELGDPAAAIRHSAGFRFQPRAGMDERQARYLIDVARAETAVGRGSEAIETLLHAESISPEEVRTHRLTRNVVKELTAGGDGPALPLRQLAARSGIAEL